MKSRVPAVSLDCRADALDRLIVAAALMLEQAEQMKCLRITGSDRQDLAAHPLCFRRASFAVMRERRAKPSGDRHRRAACGAALLPRPGSSPSLLPVHRDLIAQLINTYPPRREIANPR